MQTSSRRNVVVTGSNKGIGYAIVEKLIAGEIPYDIITTSRNTKLGEEAYKALKNKYPKSVSTLTYHQLDIDDDKSVDSFVDWLRNTHGKLDVLVNNAAIQITHSTEEQKIKTVQTNFFNTIKLTEKLVPLLSENGKIINVSSLAGTLALQAPTLKKALEDENLTEEQLFEIGKNILDYIQDFPYQFNPENSYPSSKALLNTYIRKFLPKKLKKSQQFYAICPGLCDTDLLKNFKAKASEEELEILKGFTMQSAEDGADTPVYLINLPFEVNPELNGQFIRERKVQAY